MIPSAVLIGALVLCLFLSALFSSSETGFLSVNRIRLRHLAEHGNKRAKRVQEMLKQPDQFFSLILIGNNLALVASSGIATLLAIRYLGDKGPAVASILLTITVLIFGEIIPKTLFRQFADVLALRITPVLDFFETLFRPLVFIFVSAMKFFTPKKKNMKSPFVTREEMHQLVKEGERTGAIDAHERDLISNVFNFGKRRVEEVMVPLTDVVVVDIDAPKKEVLSISQKHNFTRIPVFDDRVDNIIGVVNVYELLYDKKKKWQDIIRPLLFVPSTKRVGVLIKELQQRHEGLCAVINEHGSPIGIAAMEDLMEEIVGDIYDEEEEEDIPIKKVSDKGYVVAGKCDVEDINEKLGLSLSTDGFETISGYIFFRLGRVPKKGESIKGPSFTLTVEKMDKNRIVSVRLQLK